MIDSEMIHDWFMRDASGTPAGTPAVTPAGTQAGTPAGTHHDS